MSTGTTWYQLKHNQTGYVLAMFPDAMLATDYRESLTDGDQYAYSVLPAPARIAELEAQLAQANADAELLGRECCAARKYMSHRDTGTASHHQRIPWIEGVQAVDASPSAAARVKENNP